MIINGNRGKEERRKKGEVRRSVGGREEETGKKE